MQVDLRFSLHYAALSLTLKYLIQSLARAQNLPSKHTSDENKWNN